jgi:hypothetical protein
MSPRKKHLNQVSAGFFSKLCLGNDLSGDWTLVALAVTWIVCVQGQPYQAVVECVEPSFDVYN